MTNNAAASTPAEPTQAYDFKELRSVDVSGYIEKKNNLSYLSWAFAVDQLLMRDPTASWDYKFSKDSAGVEVPYVCVGATAMVFCTVKAFGVSRTSQLPVMDHTNKAVPNPDSFRVNTAMQRCLAKAIALHGLGLYIYAGEDVPEEYVPDPVKEAPVALLTIESIKAAREAVAACKTSDELRALFAKMDIQTRAVVNELVGATGKALTKAEAAAAKAAA